MLKTRLIPILLLKNGQLVRSEDFLTHQIIGDPIHEVKRFNEWNVDELIYIDITQGDYNFQRRSDHKTKGLENPLSILDEVSKTCFVPLTWGGRIRCFDDAAERFQHGADKITLNRALFDTPDLVKKIAGRYGSQAVVASMDVLLHPSGEYEVFTDGNRTPKGKNPSEWAKQLEAMGVGEILVQAIHKDGKGTGYDLPLISSVAKAVKIPVIACSGVGTYEHYAKAAEAGASAVAAANIWHFKELSDRNGKRALQRAGVNVRF
ncbi:MAG: imidazole glycerol phosphate synthase subunit HisF [Rhodospirillales bacterium]|nr:imidazole glycerol phosphate synthase subunit HisF [Alphaproteobacteria bacterium]USO03752.1 MAG: imidazole glycerol phosphate synthase subunit HisF [Rhodospirillales bacterium]